MQLSDHEIRQLSQAGMITPFSEMTRNAGQLSYGLTSYGYDARLAPHARIVSEKLLPDVAGLIDPKTIDDRLFVDVSATRQLDIATNRESSHFLIPPHGFLLGETVERFRVPRDVLVICVGKSTYARCGLIVNVTPLEPEWEGTVTLEVSNTTDYPALVYANEGIAQFIFLRTTIPCETSYADKRGKYQSQQGVTLPKM